MDIQSLGSLAPGGYSAPRPSPSESSSATPDIPPIIASSAEVAPPVAKPAPPSQKDLEKAVKAVNEFIGTFNNSLNFSIDSDTGQTVVKVIDSATQAVIKQIPSEEMLVIAKALDNIKGLLVQQKA